MYVQGLTNLVELDLSDNMLTSTPVMALSELPALMRLSLARNPLRWLATGSFSTLKYLSTLELSHCQIETVEEGAFEGLQQLEWLKLDGNALKQLGGSSVLPRSLHGVTLHDNPWRCDCRLLQLRAWLVVQLNAPLSLEPQCRTPERVVGRSVKSLDPLELACAPEITPTSVTLDVLYGANISLQCRVSGEPMPHLSWWRNGREISSHLLLNESALASEAGGAAVYTFSGPALDADGRQYSELSIFNVTDRENASFTCAARNRAGSATSNFSVSVMALSTAAAPTVTNIEYVFAVGGVVAAIVLTLVIIVVAVAVRCCCCRRRRRRSVATRDKAMGNGISLDDGTKSKSSHPTASPQMPPSLPSASAASRPVAGMNGMIPASMLIKANAGGYCGNMGEYQNAALDTMDCSPDLISDATALKWKDNSPLCLVDGLDCGYPTALYNSNGLPVVPLESYYPCVATNLSTISQTVLHQQQQQQQQPHYYSPLVAPNSEMAVLSAAGYLDPDGFPVDYGLPRPSRPTRPCQSHVRFADPPSSIRHYENFAADAAAATAAAAAGHDGNSQHPVHPDDFLADRKYPDDYGHMPSMGHAATDLRYDNRDAYPHLNDFSAFQHIISPPPEAYEDPERLSISRYSPADTPASPSGIHSATSQHLATLATLATLGQPTAASTTAGTLQRLPHESPDEGYEDEGVDGTEI